MEDVEDIYELAPMQHGLLYDSVTADDSGMYLIQLEYALRGPLDPDAFEEAWRRTVARHGILRTSFHWEGMQKPLQVVHRSAALPLERLDWSGVAPGELEGRASAFRAADRARGVDFEAAPLMRLALIQEGPDRWRLLWTFHHILMEGWSASIVLKEVLAHYRARGNGAVPELAEHRPYKDYVAFLQAQESGRAEAHWRAELAGFQSPTHLGIDRSPSRARPGTDYERLELRLDPEETRALTAFAQGSGVTLNTVCLGAWALLLARTTGDRDVVFGTMVSGRSVPLPGVDSIVGLFVNLLPVRVDVDLGAELVPWLRELQGRQARQREFEHCALVEVKSWSEVPAGLPLFETLLVFENWQGDLSTEPWDSGLEVAGVSGDNREAGHPITLVVAPGPELELGVSYDTERFDAGAIRRLLASLRTILVGMSADAEQAVGEIPFRSADEIALLDGFNATDAAPDSTGLVPDQVAARAAAAPDAPAIRFGDRSVSYGEVDARAGRIARVLATRGVGRGDRVAVCVERSPDMVATLLATWRIGAAYVPLDPAYPAARVGYILEDAGAAVLVTEAALASELPAHGAQVVVLEEIGDDPNATGEPLPGSNLMGDDLAYVIYTSGSTGKPKGVQVPHAALVNFLDSMRREPGLAADDVLVAVTTLSFDIAGLELWLPLTTGAEVALASREQAADGEQLTALLRASGATVMQATPATWRLLIQSGWSDRELTALCGGEALPPELAEDLVPCCKALWNLYGPTETTIWSATGRVEAGQPLTVGAPIANTQIHVLSSDLRRVPIGVAGEVFIGGDGLARGYSERPDLTAERFVPDPFHGQPGRRMYWTGDVGRWRADGELEILGRIDHQVKLRGFRIELGEIEAVLAGHDAVAENVVVIREDHPGDKRLVAYVACPEDAFPGASALRALLRESLPEYMVPATYVRLDALPRTPNGKVDRNALPAPEGARPELDEGFLAPRNPLEETIAGIWRSVLGLEQVGVRDNFFDLGGHSLLLMPVIGELKTQLGVRMSPGDLVMPTLGQLAALCQERMLAAGLELPGGMVPMRAEAEPATARSVDARLEPFFFGPGETLFGCLHRPASEMREVGIVICEPFGHELLQFHRALRQLAVLLADAGFPVLRFDLAGCGDSAGEASDWSVARWTADVETAIDELERRAGVERIALVGLRLGGALAARAAAARDEVEAAVLWDPVASGSAYLAELREQHARMRGYAHVIPHEGDPEEVLGFPLPAAFASDVETVDLLQLERRPAPRTLVVESNDEVRQDVLCAHLIDLHATADLQRFANPNLWVWVEDFGKMHVPREILERITAWLEETLA